MPYLSQTRAAKLAGVSRGTIANRIEDGALSRHPEGIDPAELVRVFPGVTAERVERFLAGDEGDNPASDDRSVVANRPGDDGYLADRLDEADRQAAWLRELVDRQQQVIDRQAAELREAEERAAEERRGLLAQLDRTVALLPAPAEPTPEPEPPRGFWRRVLG